MLFVLVFYLGLFFIAAMIVRSVVNTRAQTRAREARSASDARRILDQVRGIPDEMIALIHSCPKTHTDGDWDRNAIFVKGAANLREILQSDRRFDVSKDDPRPRTFEWSFDVNVKTIDNWPRGSSYDVHSAISKFLRGNGYDAFHWFSAD